MAGSCEIIIASTLATVAIIWLGSRIGFFEWRNGCWTLFAGGVVFLTVIIVIEVFRTWVFFKKHERKEVFCYSSRNRTRKFIEERILPRLDPSTYIIFKEHQDIDYPPGLKPIADHVRNGIPGERYPYLLRISGGKIHSTSLRDAVHMNYRLEDGEDNFFQLFEDAREKLQKRAAGKGNEEWLH